MTSRAVRAGGVELRDGWAARELKRGTTTRGEVGEARRAMAAWESSIAAAVSDRASWYVEGLRIDATSLRAATSPEGRRKVWRALDGLVSPRGVRRADAVMTCGRACAAVERPRGDRDAAWQGVVAARWCRDRLCPICAAMRASRLAAQLRQWVAADEARIGRSLFLTATQPRRDVGDETAGQAVDRLLSSWREVTARGRAHARVRAGMAGWVRAVEVTYSTRRVGKSRAGWHAHVHALVELHEGVEVETWRRAWVESWCAAAGASPIPQDVQRVDEARIGQVCKYPLSPFSLERPSQIRAAAEASVGRRMLEGGGTWRSWQGATFRESERELRLGRRLTMDRLAFDAESDLRIEWTKAPREGRRRLVGPVELVEVTVHRSEWESSVRAKGDAAVRASSKVRRRDDSSV